MPRMRPATRTSGRSASSASPLDAPWRSTSAETLAVASKAFG